MSAESTARLGCCKRLNGSAVCGDCGGTGSGGWPGARAAAAATTMADRPSYQPPVAVGEPSSLPLSGGGGPEAAAAQRGTSCLVLFGQVRKRASHRDSPLDDAVVTINTDPRHGGNMADRFTPVNGDSPAAT